MTWPDRLQPGDTIMFVAPAGDLDQLRMMRAKRRLEERGYRVKYRDDLFVKDGYLAGSDQRRADELMQAFRDPEVHAIFPGTGGYGTMRILNLLDYNVIRANPKILIGFSDITGLHAAINRRAGLVTWHSPNPMWGLGGEVDVENSIDNYLTKFSEKYFFQAVEATTAGQANPQAYTVNIPEGVPKPMILGSGVARGRLTGGNLSLLAALEGTPYAIDTRDAILLIEDVREAPYRIDRMLRQLQLAGKLDHLRGAVLGQFTKSSDREDNEEEDPWFLVNGVLRQYFEPLNIPVLMNYPVGHHKMNTTLPLGGHVEIDVEAKVLRVLGPEAN
jgi:muramoyltetrapeptide carboxypeptidase